MKKIIRSLSQKVISFLGLAPLNQIGFGLSKFVYPSGKILIENYLEQNLWKNPRYKEFDRLARYGKSIYTNNGTDGIIAEIFRRINPTNKYFIEFGAHSIRNNTSYLLLNDWKGLWIEGSAIAVKKLNKNLHFLIEEQKLNIHNAFITAENIEQIFAKHAIPESFDLLSVDIDGNDYWVWKAIQKYKPRVVVIEYNALFPSDQRWVMKYNPNHRWDGSSYFGASLKSLELLAKEKGYILVGCDFTGTNAYFVVDDYSDKFTGPFTSEFHYEEPRYFLNKEPGHPPGFGPFLNI